MCFKKTKRCHVHYNQLNQLFKDIIKKELAIFLILKENHKYVNWKKLIFLESRVWKPKTRSVLNNIEKEMASPKIGRMGQKKLESMRKYTKWTWKDFTEMRTGFISPLTVLITAKIPAVLSVNESLERASQEQH